MIRVGIGFASPFVASGGGGVNPLIQAFLDGDYNGATVEEYNAEFPRDTNCTVSTKLTSRIILSASPVDDTHCTLTLVSNDAVVLHDSTYTAPKTLRIRKTGKPDVFQSVGCSNWVNGASSAFGADSQYPTPASTTLAWVTGDTNTIGVVTIAAVVEDFDHLAVTPSTLTPVGGSALTATFQAEDASNVSLHRIGLVVTPSLVSVSGTGNGTIVELDLWTNALGVSETAHVTASSYPATDKVHGVEAGGAIGNSSNVVVTDVVDSYDITSSDDAPGAGATVTLTAQAKIGGSPALVAGRVVTWGALGDGSTGSPTSTTNGSGIATVSFTVGPTVSTVYNVTGTDTLGETGTSESITVSTAPPTYHHLAAGVVTYLSTSFNTASVTVPANSLLVIALGANTDTGAPGVPTAAASGLTVTLVDSAKQVIATDFDTHVRAWIADVGGGGFSGVVTFGGSGDGLVPGAYELGYYSKAEASGVVQSKPGTFAGDISTKTLAFDSAPAATSALFAAWSQGCEGDGTNLNHYDNKSGWNEESDTTVQNTLSINLEVQTFRGTTANSQATPTSAPSTPWGQQAVIVEIGHV